VALLPFAVSPFIAGYLITRSGCGFSQAAMPDAARAIADGLTAGHSPRGALAAATVSLEGPAAVEFHRIAMDLEAGTPTTRAVEVLAERFRSARVDAFCTAMVSQSLAGGDLAALMRRFAEGAAGRPHRPRCPPATAQARFTGYLVVAMPVGAALFTSCSGPFWSA
jgi:tight adherence protein B